MARKTTVFGDYMSLGQVETLKNNCTKVRWEESGGDFSDGIGCGVPAKVKNGSTKTLSKKELKLEIQRLKNKGCSVTLVTVKTDPRVFETSIGEVLVTEKAMEVHEFLFPNEVRRLGEVEHFYYGKNIGDEVVYGPKKYTL